MRNREDVLSDLEAERERLAIAIDERDHEDQIRGHRLQCQDLKRELAEIDSRREL